MISQEAQKVTSGTRLSTYAPLLLKRYKHLPTVNGVESLATGDFLLVRPV